MFYYDALCSIKTFVLQSKAARNISQFRLHISRVRLQKQAPEASVNREVAFDLELFQFTIHPKEGKFQFNFVNVNWL